MLFNEIIEIKKEEEEQVLMKYFQVKQHHI